MKKEPLKIQTCLFCYGGVLPLTHACFERDTVKALTQDMNDDTYQICRALWFNDALIDRCRAMAAEGFLKTTNDVMVMIDHDIEWADGDVLRIARKAHELQGIVGGAVAKRTRGEGIASVITQPGIFEIGTDRVLEVPYVGSAFTAIPRAVVARVAGDTKPTVQGFRPMFIPRIVPNLGDPNEFDYLSEDWSFCKHASELGFKIYLDMKPKLVHYGNYPYTVGDGFCNHVLKEKQTPPRFSLLHATRGRVKQAMDIRNLWLAKASGLHPIEYIYSVDKDDPERFPDDAPPEGTHIIYGDNRGCVDAYNRAAYISRGDILIQVHDDLFPPDNWDELLIAKIVEKYPSPDTNVSDGIKPWDNPAIIHVSDGQPEGLNKNPGLLTVLIGTRKWFIDCGFFWFPRYVSVGCDNDMQHIAEKENIIIEAKDLVFKHDWKGPTHDETQKKSYSPDSWNVFDSVFARREEEGFKKYPEAWGKQDYFLTWPEIIIP